MDILGIGIPEFFLIVLLVLILLGPKDMVAAGKNMGRWLNQAINSPTYKLLTRTGQELKNLPRNLMREANLEDASKEFEQIGKKVNENVNAIGGEVSRSFDEKKIFSQPAPVIASPPPPAAAVADSAVETTLVVEKALSAPLKTISTPDFSDIEDSPV